VKIRRRQVRQGGKHFHTLSAGAGLIFTSGPRYYRLVPPAAPPAGGVVGLAPPPGGVAGDIGVVPPGAERVAPGPPWSGALSGRCSKSQAARAKVQRVAARSFVFMVGSSFVVELPLSKGDAQRCVGSPFSFHARHVIGTLRSETACGRCHALDRPAAARAPRRRLPRRQCGRPCS
jgi:hypothetical protein